MAALFSLQQAIGHDFNDITWLKKALRHRSSGDGGAGTSNERLEFLGDRVLGLAVADMLCRAYPDETESTLATRHTALVRTETLSAMAETWDIAGNLILGQGMGKSDMTPKMLADAVEALLGAVYRDAGFDAAKAIIERHFSGLMEQEIAPPVDAKTRLQEWAQANGMEPPVYTMDNRTGPDHAPVFIMRVTMADGRKAKGEGASKQIATQAAAQTMLKDLGL